MFQAWQRKPLQIRLLQLKVTIDTSCVSRRVESWELQWVTYRAVVLLTAKIQGSVLPLHYSPSFSKHEFCFQWSRNVFPTLCVYNLLVVTVLRPKDDVGAEFCIWFLTRCSAAGRLVVGLHTCCEKFLSPFNCCQGTAKPEMLDGWAATETSFHSVN